MSTHTSEVASRTKLPQVMRAVVKEGAAPGARLVERPVPSPAPGEVLIRVGASSICGTDYHVYSWDAWAAGRVHPPLVMGHECGGEVVALGRGSRGVGLGDIVSIETHVACGVCLPCRTGNAHICEEVSILGVDRDGSFAEYLAVPAANVWKNAPGTDPALAAIQEPFGNAVHTVFAGEVTGQSVAVVGCGPIGIMAVGVARAAGAARIIASDLSGSRLEMAQRMGATHLVNASRESLAERLMEITDGQGVDVVLEMSGSGEALTEALRGSRNGARVSLLGLPSHPVSLDLAEDVIMRGITLQGITGRRMFQTWYQGHALQEAGLIDLLPLITHRLPLSEFDEAMRLLKSGEAVKIVLIP